MTQAVVDAMSRVIARSANRPAVFAKVGDSITAHGHFLSCFAGDDVQLGASSELETTRRYFLATRADETRSSFDRFSFAARSGWSTRAPLLGSPSPLEREVAAIRPAFAVVMFGTNDVYPTGIPAFERNLRTLVDRLLDLGVVPLVSSIPPRNWSRVANELIPEMNAVTRAVAQSRQVPWMDYHGTLANLPLHGLAKDGIHPQTWKSGSVPHPCWLTEPALQQGINARNLIVLQSLDRARRFLIEHQPAEPPPADLSGDGSDASPWIIPSLPFVDAQQLRERSSEERADASVDAHQVRYQMTLPAQTWLRIAVFADEGGHATVSVGEGTQAPVQGERSIERQLGPGTVHIAVRVDGAGGFRLTVVERGR